MDFNLIFFEWKRFTIYSQTSYCFERFDPVSIGLHVVELVNYENFDRRVMVKMISAFGCQKLSPLGAPSIAAKISFLEDFNKQWVHI